MYVLMTGTTSKEFNLLSLDYCLRQVKTFLASCRNPMKLRRTRNSGQKNGNVSLVIYMYVATWSFHNDLWRELDFEMSTFTQSKKTSAVGPRQAPRVVRFRECPERHSYLTSWFDCTYTITINKQDGKLYIKFDLTWANGPTNLSHLLRFTRNWTKHIK